ncbi:LysM peptidoglycan-binding domain-containing protein [Tessaracoccus antarcticus]|uniref:LysM peptidoglycan-binding domain-containing protein n=1 Tax=Tessaracoccus antarcticus TaxID=2479848 RepID=UPI0013142853|nr:LysM peptidoglycan-binding domain-containing protein [Tessaracoccus antarcticus]
MKTLAALALLVALLAGVPAMLIAWGDPSALLRVDWRRALVQPASKELVVALCSVAGWLAWALLAVTAIVETVMAMSRGRVHIHLPGIGWLQPAVGGLVAMVMAPALSSTAAEPAPPAPAHAPAVVEHQISPTITAHPFVPPAGLRAYVVRPGDELWAVAEQELGSGGSWRTILRSNPGMTADTVLTPGNTILLPSTPPVQASAAPDSSGHVTVRRGDTLWDLAEQHLGDAHRWPELFQANRDQISDPDEIDIGWRLSIPGAADTTQPRDTGLGQGDKVSATPTPSAPPPVGGTNQPTTLAPTVSPTLPPDTTPRTSPLAIPVMTDATPRATNQPSNGATGNATPVTTTEDPQWSDDVLGPVGGVLAASLFAGVIARRRVQLLQRGVGRRAATLAPEIQRFFAALVQRSHVAPELQPNAQPTSVIIGWRDEEEVRIDLEPRRCTLVEGSPEDTAALAATIITSLMCAPWSSMAEVVTVEPQEEWVLALDDPRLSSEMHLEEALTRLQRLCAQRRMAMGRSNLASLRADPDVAGSWPPVVFVFCHGLLPAHVDHVRDCLSLGEVGVSVVAPLAHGTTSNGDPRAVHVLSTSVARLGGTDDTFEPQLLNQPARRAVVSLFTSSLDDRTEPAPWWRDGDLPPHVTVPPTTAEEPIKDDAMPAWSPLPDHPTLLVLGPVELRGCHGERPGRAVGQCMEYCAWLLLNPGATASTMVRELLVAEGTRRSNTSRLRSWLGRNTEGVSYLPDAYSGRITLDPSVSSDWEQFQLLLAGGVNVASSPLLREALSLVRGRPLEGVTFQWPWVAQWVSDMESMITDAAAVLADRCLTEQDLEGAHWAIDQGQLATGDDETLEIRRIHALALSGERAELDRAVMDMTRVARAENRDLAPETIQRIQHALHLSMTRHAHS